jgi:hypothetical protein
MNTPIMASNRPMLATIGTSNSMNAALRITSSYR